jgi:hypothetical protein
MALNVASSLRFRLPYDFFRRAHSGDLPGNTGPQVTLRQREHDPVPSQPEGRSAMTIVRTLAASAAILISAGLSVPAFAQTLDAAQCSDAKGSGDQNAIRQFCPESDWPQTE